MLNLFNKSKTLPKNTVTYSHNFSRPLSQKKFSIPIFTFLTALLLVAAYFIFDKSYVFKLTRFTYKTDPSCLPQNVIESKLASVDKNYFFAHFEVVRSDLESHFICVKDISFSKIFPDSLVVTVRMRKAVATLKTIGSSTLKPKIDIVEASPSSEEAQLPVSTPSPVPSPIELTSADYLVDETGILFKTVDDESIQPEIDILDPNLKVGGKIEGEILTNSLKIMQKLKDLSFAIKKTELLGNFLYIQGDDSIQAPLFIFDLDNNISRQIAILKLILSQTQQEGKKLSRVDLRFDKPTIIYQ